jgi:hypothetical protein
MYLDKPSDVGLYTEAMDKLSATSATPDKSRQIIRELLDKMEGSL